MNNIIFNLFLYKIFEINKNMGKLKKYVIKEYPIAEKDSIARECDKRNVYQHIGKNILYKLKKLSFKYYDNGDYIVKYWIEFEINNVKMCKIFDGDDEGTGDYTYTINDDICINSDHSTLKYTTLKTEHETILTTYAKNLNLNLCSYIKLLDNVCFILQHAHRDIK